MVAEEIRKDPIYISFRGSHTAQDWKDNLKSFQTKHLDAVQGIFVYLRFRDTYILCGITVNFLSELWKTQFVVLLKGLV